jgi:hypothetical protein
VALSTDGMNQVDPQVTAAPPARPRTARERAIAKLLLGIRTRPGHSLVIGKTAAEAADLFRAVAAQVDAYRRVTVDGRKLDPDAVLRSIAGNGHADGAGAIEMRRALVEGARQARLPIVVTIADADSADVQQLERLRQSLECMPDAIETMRIVLLGTQKLVEALAQPEVRALSTRIVSIVRVPQPEGEPVRARPAAPLATPLATPRAKRSRVGLLVGAVAVAAALIAWVGLVPLTRSTRPTVGDAPSPSPAVVAEAIVPAAPVLGPPDPLTLEPDLPPPPKPLAAAAPAPAPEPVASNPEVALQVAAFTRFENARALLKQLGERFANVVIVPIERNDVKYFRVRVAGFANEAEREATAKALRAAGFAPIPVRD